MNPLPRRAAPGVTSGLRRRLLVMLISPLILLAMVNAWFDYRSAENVAQQQDQRLQSLVPLLAARVRHQTAVLGVFRPPTLLESTT